MPKITGLFTGYRILTLSSLLRHRNPGFKEPDQSLPLPRALLDPDLPAQPFPHAGTRGREIGAEGLPIHERRMQHVKGRIPVGIGKTKPEKTQQDLGKRILTQGPAQGRLKGDTVRRKDARQHVFISGQRPPHHADVVKRNLPLLDQGQDLFGHHVNLIVRAGNRDKTTERNCGLWIVDCGPGLP